MKMIASVPSHGKYQGATGCTESTKEVDWRDITGKMVDFYTYLLLFQKVLMDLKDPLCKIILGRSLKGRLGKKRCIRVESHTQHL